MHQYYRDVFTRTLDLPEADVLPAHVVAEILHYSNSDLSTMKPKLLAAMTGLKAEKDEALKDLMCAITLANNAFDHKKQGQQQAYPAAMAEEVTQYVVAALQKDKSLNFVVAAVQILFRINEIESALFLISNNLSLLSNSAVVLKILLLICLMEEDDNQAQIVIQHLTADSALIGEDPFTLLMVVCGIYRLGGVPESFIDFRPLAEAEPLPDYSRYQWRIPHVGNGKTTVLVACDKKYYLEHARALVASVYDTNGTELNIHLHVYNCDDDLEAQVRELVQRFPNLAISLSTEVVPVVRGNNVHYASRRFIFMRYALEQFAAPVLLLDADCLVRQRWHETLHTIYPKGLILTQNDAAPMWERVRSGFLYADADALGFSYLDIVARFIDRNLASGNAVRFLEHVALSFAVDVLPAVDQMRIGRESAVRLIDVNHQDTAFSWSVATQKNGDGVYQQYKTALCEKYLAAHEAY
ncbi:hypothetical protein GTGU_00079 [Trabulsiella guamensis ATCC 49490]|uniref:Uncharacterized protein n=2 Tax=Trabulsiella guamensis TaxID=158852 RepID=A0A085ASP4_9ENTR|nr:hypothetical protein GTGU_00079 [Trabulsiella guamensis ATCC 49490]